MGVRLSGNSKRTYSHKLVALPLHKHKILQSKPSGRATSKQLHPFPDSRPPTSCSTANISNLDVGVRLNDKREKGKSPSNFLLYCKCFKFRCGSTTKSVKGNFFSYILVALPLRKHYVSANKTKWEGDIKAITSRS